MVGLLGSDCSWLLMQCGLVSVYFVFFFMRRPPQAITLLPEQPTQRIGHKKHIWRGGVCGWVFGIFMCVFFCFVLCFVCCFFFIVDVFYVCGGLFALCYVVVFYDYATTLI